MAVRKTTKSLYLTPVLSKAVDILRLLQAENQPMTLESNHRQAPSSETKGCRAVKSFVHRRYLSHWPDELYHAATALKHAEEFVRSKVDLVIEFQVEQEVAPMIGDKLAGAKIPVIAIDIPHPHATYFGVDNYRVGIEAGQTLAAYATENW